jgi:hypothetical protein
MQANPMTAAVALLGSAPALSALVIPASADAISDWAAKADAVATEQRESPWSRARTLAIVLPPGSAEGKAAREDRGRIFAPAAAASKAGDPAMPTATPPPRR